MAHFLFASYEVNPTTPGGVGTFISGIIELLLQDGHRVSLILDIPQEQFEIWKGRDSLKIGKHEHLTSLHLSALCADMREGRDSFPSDAHWKSFQFAHAVRTVHGRTPVDFAEFFDYCGVAYYSLIGRAAHSAAYPRQIAIRLHNTIEIIDRRVSSDFASFRVHDYMLERSAIGLADLVLSPGARYWEDEAAALYRIDRSRVQSSFPVRAVLPFRADPATGRDVVFVGRISTFKGIDRVLNLAVAALADAELSRLIRRFVLVGPDETVSSSLSERDLLAIAEGVPEDRLVFRGRLSEAQMLDCYAEAAVAVFPNRMESFCYAAHEAHMAGVPLILSDTAAFRDHFEDGHTALFFNNTIPDLLEKLRACFRDTGLRQRLSDSVRAHTERYRQHNYAAHLAGPTFNPPQTAQGADLTVIVVPQTAAPATPARETATRLAAALPGATLRYLSPADHGPRVKAFGRFWSMQAVDGQVIPPQAERLRSAAAFVAAGTSLDPMFLTRAAGILEAEPRIGAVIPGHLRAEGRLAASSLATMLDRSAQDGPMLHSAVMAVDPGASLVDLCADGSPMTELAALLHLREQGRIIVDDPAPALARQQVEQARHWDGVSAFLRRNAWRLDPVAIANHAADISAVASCITLRPLVSTDPQELHEHVQASLRYPGHLFLHAFGTGRPDGGKVTVLRLRRAPGQKLIPWTEVEWIGPWETTAAWDWSAGLRASRGGALHLTGATDPEISLLLGPDQHRAALIWQGLIFSIDLKDNTYRSVTLRPSTLQHLWTDPDPARPLLLEGRATPIDEWVSLVARSMAEPGGMAVFLLDRSEEPLAAACHPSAKAVTIPARLREDAARMAATFITATHLSRVSKILLFGADDLLGLACSILEAAEDLTIEFYLRPGIAWRSGGWEGMQMAARSAQRFAGRLLLHAPPGGTHEALTLLGATVKTWNVPLPPLRVALPSGPISLILAPSTAQVPAMGHIVAAAAETVRRGADISAIYIPSHETQSLRLAEVYGIAALTRRYEDPEQLITSLIGTRFIYLSVFPDGSIPGAVLSTFAQGGLAMTSAGTLDLPHSQLRSALSTALWEDAEVLAGQVSKAISSYDHLLQLYSAEVEPMSTVA